MPTISSPEGRRRFLFARTALCGALAGFNSFVSTPAAALPVGGIPQVSPGGGAPTITNSVDRTDVKLNAPRTVLSWTTFNVLPTETVSFQFDDNSWVVLNRVTGLTPSKIEGVVEGKVGSNFGGNIWFSSQNSIIFGKGAQIDAGSLFVAIGTPNLADFLNPSSNLFSFSGSDVLPNSRIMVLSNATLTAHGGMVALMGPTVQTRANALVRAVEGSVLYGSARNFQIRLEPGAGGDFDLVDFIVPNASDGAESQVAIDLGGDTRANSVFLAAVSKSAIGSAVINLEGMVTAQAAKADGGDIVLSGGGGISNRAPAPTLDGAAPTDIYLNKASASRDIQIRNVGRIFGRPWARPGEEAQDPPTLADDATPPEDDGYSNGNGNGNGFGNGNGNGNGFFGMAPLESVVLDKALVSALFDPTAVSSISSGRDTNIQATASIELGRIVASGDLNVEGADIKANSLITTGALTATSTKGDVLLAGVGVMRESTISGHTDVGIDSVAAPSRLTVTAGRNITLGDGVSTVSGAIDLSAAQNVTVDLAQAKVDSITAGGSVNLRGGAIEANSITAPRLFGLAESIKIGTATTSGDLYVVATSGDAIVGSATAGDDIYVIANHGTASLGDATLTGAAPDSVGVEFAGNPDMSGNGRVVHVESLDFDAQLGLGTGGVTGATAVTVRAGQDAIVDVLRETPGAFSVRAARDATLKAPSVQLDNVSAGRDLTIGSTTGDFTLTNALSATRNVTITAAGALTVADVRADAGSVALIGGTVTAGAGAASEDLTLRATNINGSVTTTSYSTGRDLIIQGSTLNLGSTIGPVARDLSITSLGNFTSTTALNAGRNLTLDVAGTANVSTLTASGTLRIVAGDLALGGVATAANAQIESKSGVLRVGGSAGGSGLVVDNGEFGQLRVTGSLKFYAGSTTDGTRGDLFLQDLTVNPANTPNLSFLVGPNNNANVTGVVAPTASGGILRIGDATDFSWRPDSILITGGLGAATFTAGQYSDIRAFTEVRLAARNDILMGSQRFITLIQGTAVGDIDTAAGRPAGVAPTAGETNKIFVSAGKLEVSAENKVVQQNTAPLGFGQAVGVFFTGQSNPALIIDPPKVVELWGAFAGANGQVVTGTPAGTGVTFTVVDSAGNPTSKPADANYRFNSCDVGTSNCSPAFISGGGSSGSGGGGGQADPIISQTSAGVLAARDQLGDAGAIFGNDSSNSNDSESSEEAGEAQVSSESLTAPPVVLGVAPPATDEIVTDPVTTGTGSEEIWRQRRQKQ